MTASIEFANQVAALQGYLLKFARLQLRNDDWAQDAVSETVLAALAKPTAFANRSQLKTWLVGILKHKIIDALRHHQRECTLGHDADDASSEIEELSAMAFDADGFLTQAPMMWGHIPQGPDQQLEQRQFFQVLEACSENLPEVQARVFMMREWLDLSVEEICKELNLTSTNLYVLLHRARLRLRECLEIQWFSRAERNPA